MRGSVLKRGRNWSYVLYLGRDEKGRKRQKWVGGFHTRKAAEAALTEALHRLHTGVWADPGRQTVGESSRPGSRRYSRRWRRPHGRGTATC